MTYRPQNKEDIEELTRDIMSGNLLRQAKESNDIGYHSDASA